MEYKKRIKRIEDLTMLKEDWMNLSDWKKRIAEYYGISLMTAIRKLEEFGLWINRNESTELKLNNYNIYNSTNSLEELKKENTRLRDYNRKLLSLINKIKTILENNENS